MHAKYLFSKIIFAWWVIKTTSVDSSLSRELTPSVAHLVDRFLDQVTCRLNKLSTKSAVDKVNWGENERKINSAVNKANYGNLKGFKPGIDLGGEVTDRKGGDQNW